MLTADRFNGLACFENVVAMLGEVTSLRELCALNEAVDARFLRDCQQLSMSDTEWEDWTLLLAKRAAELEVGQDTK